MVSDRQEPYIAASLHTLRAVWHLPAKSWTSEPPAQLDGRPTASSGSSSSLPVRGGESPRIASVEGRRNPMPNRRRNLDSGPSDKSIGCPILRTERAPTKDGKR